VAIFRQTKRIFEGRSSATVKKMCEVWRKMDLFGPDSLPPNPLQNSNKSHHMLGNASGDPFSGRYDDETDHPDKPVKYLRKQLSPKKAINRLWAKTAHLLAGGCYKYDR
jgi:hypothetical protein